MSKFKQHFSNEGFPGWSRIMSPPVSISHITDVYGQPGAAHDGGGGPPPGAGPRPLPALAGLLLDGGQLGLLHLPVRLVVVLHHQLVAEDALAALGVAQLGLGLALGRHQQTVDTVDLRLGGKSGYSLKCCGGSISLSIK